MKPRRSGQTESDSCSPGQRREWQEDAAAYWQRLAPAIVILYLPRPTIEATLDVMDTSQRNGEVHFMTHDDELIDWISDATLPELMTAAAAKRDASFGRLISTRAKFSFP